MWNIYTLRSYRVIRVKFLFFSASSFKYSLSIMAWAQILPSSLQVDVMRAFLIEILEESVILVSFRFLRYNTIYLTYDLSIQYHP